MSRCYNTQTYLTIVINVPQIFRPLPRDAKGFLMWKNKGSNPLRHRRVMKKESSINIIELMMQGSQLSFYLSVNN